jgi:ATP-dependent Clp protease ATP-binding subunit ClpC
VHPVLGTLLVVFVIALIIAWIHSARIIPLTVASIRSTLKRRAATRLGAAAPAPVEATHAPKPVPAGGVDGWEPLDHGHGAVGELADTENEDGGAPLDAATDPRSLAMPLMELLEGLAHPLDLVADRRFDGAASIVAAGPTTSAELVASAAGDNALVWYLATEALGRRAGREDLVEPLLHMLADHFGWRRWFVLRALHAHACASGTPVAAHVVTRLDGMWRHDPQRSWLVEFLDWRTRAGDPMTLAPVRPSLDALNSERRTDLDAVIDDLAGTLPAAIVDEYRAWQHQRIDIGYLASVGQVLDADDELHTIVQHPALDAAVAALADLVTRSPARAAVVVGEPGVGKSTALACLAGRLRAEGWVIFRCSAPELLAGQTFLGQMEDRIHRIAREAENRPVLWIVPEFHDLFYAGRTLQSPTGLLDQLFPFMERGTIHFVGETSPTAYEKVQQQRPRLRSAVEAVRIEPLPADATAELVGRWARRQNIEAHIVAEAQQLAAQHLADRAAPGSVLTLLKLAVDQVKSRRGPDAEVERRDLLETMSSLTGLPLDVLDDGAALDLDRVRDFFASRVLGQDEAIETLLERIALVKAGLTDPTRPQGVFFFVGPSGTGKTELAKALAEYLFGSPDRMIRLDMSEFHDAGMTHRLLGTRSEYEAGSSLVDEVRRQPFSVVLLDEFEKADPRIWDLFLQLFDDGRLTDQAGNTASFRNTIIIMTSNLGADARAAGFAAGDDQAVNRAGQRTLEQTFRPEFINRIDRIVWFRPLGRTVMRRLLDKEIREVLGRRGLRNRSWAIEWEESAIELLLNRGFSQALGARPLKRAVEQYLLAPLAMSIVGRRVPQGDQFLYIGSAGNQITVEFVDPDGADPAPIEHVDEAAREVPALEDIVRAACGDAGEVGALQAEYEHLEQAIGGEAWQERKAKAIAEMAEPQFWVSSRRYAVMGTVEYMDRIEVGFDTAGSLLRRINRGRGAGGGSFPPHLVRRLAQQLYLVGEAMEGLAAGLPRDAFVSVTAARDPGDDPVRADDFARRIDRMYRSWADRRRMKLEILQEQTGDPYSVVLAISGFAAYPILAAEHGQHILESPAAGKAFSRIRTVVLVAPQPAEPPTAGRTLRAQAARTLADVDAARAAVVRRYRDDPSPLVRDSVRGWRTGRIDQVLDGDFDLIG